MCPATRQQHHRRSESCDESVVTEAEGPELHLLAAHGREAVLFDPASLRILTTATPDASQRVGQAVVRGAGASSALVWPTPSDGCGPQGLVASLSGTKTEPAEMTGGRPRLSRLTLHIANVCNLACSYCYAAAGCYHLPQGLMSGERAAELLGEALQIWDIERLMFFGGEPSLNPDAIAEACLLITELHRRGLIAHRPEFGVISNLAGHGEDFDEFLGLCKLLGIHITVSIDGPQEVHDANRRDGAGRGSYARVRDNLHRARDLGLNLAVECTYTRAHLARGMTILDLMRFFYNEFGLRQAHIAPMLGSGAGDDPAETRTLIDHYCEAIQYMVGGQGADGALSVSLGQRQLSALATREPIPHYCPAGHSELAIGPDGLVYPCFMFVGDGRFQMGPLDASRWPYPEGRRVLGEIVRNDKARHPACRACWARGVCSGCSGGDHYEHGDLAVKSRCALTKGMAAEAIVRLAEIGQGHPIGYYGNGHRLAYLSA